MARSGRPGGAPENMTNAGKGRPVGVKNKFTGLKKAFVDAFVRLGGVDELTRWAKEEKNRPLFYQMIARMLPNKAEVGGFDGAGIIIQLVNYNPEQKSLPLAVDAEVVEVIEDKKQDFSGDEK